MYRFNELVMLPNPPTYIGSVEGCIIVFNGPDVLAYFPKCDEADQCRECSETIGIPGRMAFVL